MSAVGGDRGRIALLDACTLIPIRLTPTLLWLAEAGLFEVLWSDPILDEVERNLPKIGISPEQGPAEWLGCGIHLPPRRWSMTSSTSFPT